MAKLYNANDTAVGRAGGPYLDIELGKELNEIRRDKGDTKTAANTFAAFAGVDLVSARELLRRHPGGAVDLMSDGDAESVVKPTAVVA